MPRNDDLAAALSLAAEYHYGQTDRAGRSYMEHICAVVAGCTSPRAKVVAALHDILEDTDCTADILGQSFGGDIVVAVCRLTRDDGESYDHFIGRVAEDELATEVKLADLAHNSDLDRLDTITDKDWDRYAKYQNARSRLLRARACR